MIKVDKLNPFGRMCVSMGMIPSSYKESLTYEEQLMWFCNYLEKTVIPTVNNNADALIELQGLYNELKTYVDEYFENLDVQEEINNKLDDMAESGELTEIIAQYLGLAGMITFDTVAEMKLAENLVNGSKCTTLGYHSLNDGGKATYKVREVTNEDVVDEIFIIALNDENLIAELIVENKTISLLQAGCDPTETTDNSNIIEKLIEHFKDGGTILIPTGKYLCSDISIDDDIYNLNIEGQGFYSVLSNKEDEWTIQFRNKTHNCCFKNFAIWCYNIGKGIKYNKISDTVTADHGMQYYENVSIRNTAQGFYLRNMVYLTMRKVQVGVTNSNENPSTNYGIDYSGYEYNTFEECSFNANSKADFNSVILRQTNFDSFLNCEFAYSGTGILVDTTDISATASNLVVRNSKIYNINKGLHIHINSQSLSNATFENNAIYTSGSANTDRPILIDIEDGSNKKVNVMTIMNNKFYKITGTSPSAGIEINDDLILNLSLINNIAGYTSGNYLNIGNNVPNVFIDNNANAIREATITADGTATEFTIYNTDNALPIIANRTPLFLCNIPDLAIPYSVCSYYNPGNLTQLRGKIKFASAPTAGTYTVYYNVRY